MRRAKQGVALLAMLFLGSIVAFGCYFVLLVREAEDQMGTLEDRIKESMMPPSKIVSSDGKLLYQIAAEYRVPVKFSELPEHVKEAVLAAEDKRFYEHSGFDAIGLARAVAQAIVKKHVSQGGSTLTMQLAKLLYSGSERTIERKLKDIAIASAMEKQLSKDQILLLYLNYVYFGEGAHGIGAASQVYFRKKVKDLTLAEAAMLARCVRRPSKQNPFIGQTKQQVAYHLPSDSAMTQKKVVLGIMRAEKMINEAQYQKALKDRPRLNPNPRDSIASKMVAPYFVDHVNSILKRDMPDVDLKAGGYRVETTLDSKLQALAEKEVRRVVQQHRRQGITTGAFVAMDSEGRILCEVGGADYKRNQFNMISQGSRQPGSAFKPFVYSAALASGALGFGDYVSNVAKSYWDAGARQWYRPANLGRTRWGSSVPLATAIKYSINLPAVNTTAQTGPQTIVGYARDAFGFPASRFKGVGPWSYSLGLGTWPLNPLEMLEGYSVFMTGGNRVEPRPILRVIGPDGEVIKRYETLRFNNVLDAGVVGEIDNALREVVTGGTGTQANVVPNARGKTGTTQDGKDMWFCGYTAGLVGIGWVASEHRSGNRWVYKATPAYGGRVTVQIWAGVMKEAYARFGHSLPKPSDEAPTQPLAEDEPLPNRRERNPDVVVQNAGDIPRPIDSGPPAAVNPAVGDPAPMTTPDPPPVPAEEAEPAADPPPRRPRREDPPPETQLTEVEVCADSGMRAGLYCPETVPRLFERNRAPRRRCTLHRGNGGY
ncbi:MAG TPA: transglycosylase domain-containing protein [Fimbriimonas sp.]